MRETNFRINPTNATVINNVVDTTTGTVQTGAAYTNNFAQTLGTGAPTTLYTRSDHEYPAHPAPAEQRDDDRGYPGDVEWIADRLLNAAGFDIPSSVRVATAGAPATGRGYVHVEHRRRSGRIYAIDLATAALTPISEAIQFDPSLRRPGRRRRTADRDRSTLTSSATPSSLDQPVTLTATLVPADATGMVSFTLGDAPIAGCEARPIASGVATCATAFGTAGTLALNGYLQRRRRVHLPISRR